MEYYAMWRHCGRTEKGEWVNWESREVKRESWGQTEPLLPQFLLRVLVSRSFADLRFVSYPCTFPANLPLLIKPGGVGFYYLQLTKPGLKQMRVYFQIIEPKRLEASTQPRYLWKMQRNLHAYSQKDALFAHAEWSRKKGNVGNSVEVVLNGCEFDPMTYIQ